MLELIQIFLISSPFAFALVGIFYFGYYFYIQANVWFFCMLDKPYISSYTWSVVKPSLLKRATYWLITTIIIFIVTVFVIGVRSL